MAVSRAERFGRLAAIQRTISTTTIAKAEAVRWRMDGMGKSLMGLNDLTTAGAQLSAGAVRLLEDLSRAARSGVARSALEHEVLLSRWRSIEARRNAFECAQAKAARVEAAVRDAKSQEAVIEQMLIAAATPRKPRA